MWRSSRSNRERRRQNEPRLHNEPRRCGLASGFTLLEAMVSLLLLVIVLIVAMTMLFQMRAFAERQQYFMLPRQSARRAADYLSFYFAGASDVNYVDSTRPSPNALIMYYDSGTPGVLTQASYNNLGCPDATGATTCTETGNGPRVIPANPPAIPAAINSTNFGDIGTDIITMVSPFDPGRYQVFAPIPALGPGVNLYFNFRAGCNCAPPACVAADDTNNRVAFQAATGFDGAQSALLMLVDRNGNWSYVRIPAASYAPDAFTSCNDVTNFKNIHAGPVDTASATLPAPPNGVAGLIDPVYLVTGLQVISFRVLTDSVDGLPKLQQKLGLFDPATDNPGVAFTNVMENVEDLQVAYMYSQNAAAGAAGAPTNSSLVWNTSTQMIVAGALCPGCTQHVPSQVGPSGVPPPLDITNVIGVRVSVTGRSPLLPLGAQKLTNVGVQRVGTSEHFRPASEDHVVTLVAGKPNYDLFDHYRATATLMLRNRIPRG
jgi:type II secretory pathway pseudopilin PulG